MSYQKGEPDALHHLALDAGFTQDVIWSNARLTAVDKLSPGDSPPNRMGQNMSEFQTFHFVLRKKHSTVCVYLHATLTLQSLSM